jgi:hypothetical protein
VEAPTLTLELGRARSGFVERVADEWLWSDLALTPGARREPRPRLPPAGPGGRFRRVVLSSGTVEGREVRVAVERNARGDRRVELEDGTRFWVARGGGRVVRRAGGPRLALARRVERALGAPLALALAARGVHLLHASALAGRSGVLALAGDPGAGKSTLAAAATLRPGLGLERVADDILPVRLGAVSRALPSFPQLKLPGGPAYADSRPASLPLAALVEIEHVPGRTRAEIERLSAPDAVAALARATVAARLFDQELLAAHFEAAAAAAVGLPVLRLVFPSGPDGIGAALTLLAAAQRA